MRGGQQQRQRGQQGHVRGEIVEVEGGHIVRSTGRKDRHSKVCTAKGPRDRRVRLSAPTAIQFYDVQDRLGFDRPSKALDWLILNAKPSIDRLARLPPFIPTSTAFALPPANPSGDSAGKKPMQSPEPAFAFGDGSGSSSSSCFLPPSLGSGAIADTIKSFFPMPDSPGPHVGYRSVPSSAGGQAQDLRLSLQSFQDPAAAVAHHAAFPHSAALQFDQMQWYASEQGAGIGGGGYLPHAMLAQSQLFTQQRGPLQSSYSPSVHAWADPVAAAEYAMQFGLASAGGDFAGFRIPARIQGEDEEHAGGLGRPSCSSSASQH